MNKQLVDKAHEIVHKLASLQNSLLLKACASGLYRSIDNGTSWHACTVANIQDVSPIFSVAMSPNVANDNTMFAGGLGYVLHTSDRGETWDTVPVDSPPSAIVDIAFSPNFAADRCVFAATNDAGVYCSTDAGNTWQAWNFGLLDLCTLALAVSPQFPDNQTVFVATETGLFHSNNSGKSWHEVMLPIEYEPVLSLNIDHTGYVAIGTEMGKVLTSHDNGHDWQVHSSATQRSMQWRLQPTRQVHAA